MTRYRDIYEEQAEYEKKKQQKTDVVESVAGPIATVDDLLQKARTRLSAIAMIFEAARERAISAGAPPFEAFVLNDDELLRIYELTNWRKDAPTLYAPLPVGGEL